MAYFPTSPTDGQTVTVNGILYTYNTAKGAWKRAVSSINNLSVAGNITAAGNISAGNITASGTSSANKLYVTDGIFWSGNGTAFASTTYSNANVASYLLTGAVIGSGASNVVVGATTQSESITTGALVVQGGVGIAGNLFVGGNLTVSNVSYEYREVVTTTELVQGNLVAAAGTTSTNTTTGALVVVGGAGISGALNIANTGDVSANIGSFQTYANTAIGSLATGANANTAAYLLTATGNIAAGNVIVSSNIYGGKYYTSGGIYWSNNGAAYASGSGGGSFTASATAPTSPTTGSFWYKTTTDVLYEYINDGTTNYWIDIQSQTIASNTSGVSTYAGTVFGANITFTGAITGTVGYLIERANVVASAPPAVTNIDLITAPILYFTSNTTQNITANIRGNSTTTLNSLLSIGQSTTFVIFVPNATAYYVNTVKVDNTTVTPYWQGGFAISGGNADCIDIYTFAVLKTANATFKVFASQVKYQNLGP